MLVAPFSVVDFWQVLAVFVNILFHFRLISVLQTKAK